MLYIMRHGRTVWNMEHKLQGKTDVPLGEAGRPVVEQAAAAYRDTHIDVCYCSPLIRAVETAEIVLRGREIPIITDVRLEASASARAQRIFRITRTTPSTRCSLPRRPIESRWRAARA